MQTFQLVPNPKTGRDRVNVWERDMRFTPDGRYLHVPGETLNFLNTQENQPPIALTDIVYGFSNGGKFSVGRGEGFGNELIVTNIRTGRRLATRELNEHSPVHGAVTADGTRFYVLVWPPRAKSKPLVHITEIRVFAADTLRPLFAFGRVKEQANGLALSSSGNRLATFSYDTGFKVWDITSKQSVASLPVQIDPGKLTNSFALSHDGSRLATVSKAGLTIWDTATGGEVLRSGKHRRGVTAVACHPSKLVLTTGDNAGNVFLWDHTGNVLTRYDWKLTKINILAFAPDGLRCAAVDAKGKVVIWDIDA